MKKISAFFLQPFRSGRIAMCRSMCRSMCRGVLHQSVVAFVFLVCVVCSHEVDASDPYEIFLEAAQATQNTAFQGVMQYKRSVFDEIWKAEFAIEHDPDQATKIVFHSPDIIKNHVIIRTKTGVWVTPLSEKERDATLKEMELFPAHRILDEGKVLFFQASFDEEHKDQFMQNYKLVTDYDESSEEDFLIQVVPLHEHRPSLEAHFDRETKIQRRCKRFNHEGELSESFTFIHLEIHPRFSSRQFTLDQLKKIRSFSDSENKKDPVKLDFDPFSVQWIPRGFLQVHTDMWEGRHGTTHHTLFSDGFAKISVFQRKLSEKERKEDGPDRKDPHNFIVNRFQKWGSWVYFRDIDGLRITAVGDLSPRYMGKILSKIDK